MAEALPDTGRLGRSICCRLGTSFVQASPQGAKISVQVGPALETSKLAAAQESFDLVFIDADRSMCSISICYYRACTLP